MVVIEEEKILGAQRPRLQSIPQYKTTLAKEAFELLESANVHLDDWQKWYLAHSLGQREDGRWSAFECGLVISRQNGKTELVVARMIVGLFLLREKLQIYTSNRFDSAIEIFRRLVDVIEECPKLRNQVKLVRGRVGTTGNGKETVELDKEHGGCRVRFKARSPGSGRGFSCDGALYLDESMYLTEAFMGDVKPIQSAQPKAQCWYLGSAVDEGVHEDGIVFARVRERGIAGDDPRLLFAEWSIDPDAYQADPSIAKNPLYWAQANPAMGIRIDQENIANEYRSMPFAQFLTERLSLGHWPRTDGFANRPIAPEDWKDCMDLNVRMQQPLVLAFDVPPDRSHATIAAAGKSPDGFYVIDVLQYERNTNWVVKRLQELVAKHRVSAICCDAAGAAGSLLPEVMQLPTEVIPVSARELAQSCGLFFDCITDRTLKHGGQGVLSQALDGAVTRSSADGPWKWNRKDSTVDISPLVGVTLALWGFVQKGDPKAPGVINLNQMAQVQQETAVPEIPDGVGPFQQRSLTFEQMDALAERW